MRRTDKEITDYGKMLEIVDLCDCFRIGLIDDKGAYIVPLSFGYETAENNGLILYFHGAAAGKKYELIRRQDTASFEMDCRHELKEAELGCNYTCDYLSVMGNGKVELLSDYEEKCRAFKCIFRHYTKQDEIPMNEAAVRAVAVYRLTVTSWSAKEHK